MSRRGFTLVELLIVFIIIGILAAIGIPQFAVVMEKAKGGEARAGLGYLQTAEKIYFAENEAYYAFDANATANPIVLPTLDIALSQKYWAFKVEVPHPVTDEGYLATATRRKDNSNLTMDHTGAMNGTWEYL